MTPTPKFFVSNVLAADVLLNNTTLFFDGPSVSQGNVGTWLALGHVTLQDTGGISAFNVRLHDGVTIKASTLQSISTSFTAIVSLAAIFTNPSGNIRISVKDQSFASGKILSNVSGDSSDSSLTAIRIG